MPVHVFSLLCIHSWTYKSKRKHTFHSWDQCHTWPTMSLLTWCGFHFWTEDGIWSEVNVSQTGDWKYRPDAAIRSSWTRMWLNLLCSSWRLGESTFWVEVWQEHLQLWWPRSMHVEWWRWLDQAANFAEVRGIWTLNEVTLKHVDIQWHQIRLDSIVRFDRSVWSAGLVASVGSAGSSHQVCDCFLVSGGH